MRYLISILCIFYCVSILAQHNSRRVFGIADGLKQAEVLGVVGLPDSTIILTEVDGTVSQFDGYRFSQVDDLHQLKTTTAYQTICNSSSCFLITNRYNGERPFYYCDGKNNLLIKQNNPSFYSPYLSRDTFFRANLDSILWFNPQTKNFEHHSSMLERGMPTIKKSLIPIESFDGQIIRFKDDLLERTDTGYQEISFDELAFRDAENIQILEDFDLNNPIARKELVSNMYFPRRMTFSEGLNCSSHFEYQRTGYYLITHPRTKKLLSIVHAKNIKLPGIAITPQSFLHSATDGPALVQNHIYYFSSNASATPLALHTITEAANGDIYFGGYGSGGSYWDGDSIHVISKSDFPKKILPGSMTTQDGIMLFFHDNIGMVRLYGLKDNQSYSYTILDAPPKMPRQNIPFHFTGYYIDTLQNGQLAFGLSQHGLGITTQKKGTQLKVKLIATDKGMELINVIHFVEDRSNQIWCGRGSQGIAMYDPVRDTAFTWLRNAEIPHNFGSTCGKLDHKGNLWLGSNDGVKFIQSPQKIRDGTAPLFDIAKHIQLPNGDRSMVAFMEIVDSFLVVGNNSSVSFLSLPSFYRGDSSPLIYQLVYGEDIEGGGAEQNAVLFDSQRRLWLGSQEGALMIDWDKFDFDRTTNQIELRKIQAGNSDLILNQSGEIELPKDNRNCQINFGPRRNTSLRKNIFFDYFLINEHKDTILQKQYDQLGTFKHDYFVPGNYHLSIIAKKHGQIIDTKNITIDVPLSLGENPWFWSSLIGLILFALIGFLLFRNRQKQILNAKELQLSKMEAEKNNLQIQAIISSFNPHFINNSLHWVQSRYNKDEALVKLVGRLSENIAAIFNNTKNGKAYHSIEEELFLVKNYIAIQKIRFRDSFRFEIIGADQLNLLHHNILLMQLQIHVENAVEHGLRNRKESSYVRLELKDDGQYFTIKIEDDGCGRTYAAEIGSQGTQTGTQMIKSLIDIYNQNNLHPIKQKYEDNIFNDGNRLYGTRVIIQYPKDYNYEL